MYHSLWLKVCSYSFAISAVSLLFQCRSCKIAEQHNNYVSFRVFLAACCCEKGICCSWYKAIYCKWSVTLEKQHFKAKERK